MRRIFSFRYIIALTFVGVAAWIGAPFFIKQPVVIYYDSNRSGEYSMAHGISAAIKQLDSTCSVEVFTQLQKDEFEKRLHGAPAKLITIGQSGFDIIISHNLYGWNVYHVTHQIFDDHQKIKNKATLFLPKHLINSLSDAKNVKWISGVPVDISKEQILKEYEKHADEIPKSPEYLVVILAGDVETPERSIATYSHEEAENLAKYVVATAGNKHIIVLNGPRTGKHCSTNSHKDNKPDCITRSFIEDLKKLGEPSKQITLFDFQFGKPSLYKAVLGLAAQHEGTHIYVPGESNSMITDMQVLGLPAIIYEHSAMNSMHKSNVEAGYMPYLDEEFQQHKPAALSGELSNPNIEVAESILN